MQRIIAEIVTSLEYRREICSIRCKFNTNNIIRPKTRIKPKLKTKMS